MWKKIAFAAAALLGLAGTPVVAEYTVKGSISCESAMEEDFHEHFREYNKWWLLGYFTARNYENGLTRGYGVDNEAIYQTAMVYCVENPGGDWDDAAIYTYNQY